MSDAARITGGRRTGEPTKEAAGRLSRYLDENRPRGFVVRVSEAGEATIRHGKPWVRSGEKRDLSQMRRLIARCENVERAGRRARGQMRRFAVHNMLRYMWVFTYAEGKYDHAEVVRDVQAFLRRVKRELGDVGPYMYGLEPHTENDHGWHVNVFFSRRLPHDRLKALWMKGGDAFGYEVRVKDWGRDRGKGSSLRERVRAGALYGAKYASKGVEELAVHGTKMQEGQHRYECSRGHSPRWTVTETWSQAIAVGLVMKLGNIVRLQECDAAVGGGLWLRFLPYTTSGAG